MPICLKKKKQQQNNQQPKQRANVAFIYSSMEYFCLQIFVCFGGFKVQRCCTGVNLMEKELYETHAGMNLDC